VKAASWRMADAKVPFRVQRTQTAVSLADETVSVALMAIRHCGDPDLP